MASTPVYIVDQEDITHPFGLEGHIATRVHVTTDKKVDGTPSLPVYIVEDDDLEENGGVFQIRGGRSIGVHILTRSQRAVMNAPVMPIYIVSGAAPIVTINVLLSWTDVSTTETGQELQRRTDGGSWQTIAFPAANATSANDTVQPGHTYEWRVRAVSGSFVSPWSNVANLTT